MKKVLLSSVFLGIAFVSSYNSVAQSKYRTGNTAKPAPQQNTTTPPTNPATQQQTAPKTTGNSRYVNANNKAGTGTVKTNADTTIKNNNNTTPPVTGSSRYRPGNNTAVPTTTDNNATNNTASGATASGNVTINYDTTIQGGFDVKPEISLRNNYAVDRSRAGKDRKPLEYEDIREDDAIFSTFVWREIDGREKINQAFMYPGKDDNGDQRFFSIILSAIKNDSVVAFSSENDRFTKPLTVSDVMNMVGGKLEPVDVVDPVTGITERTITKKPMFSPDSVYTFRIKEQVLFDKESSRLFTRIIGIAPIAKQVVAGKSVPRVLFWVYYPDMRKTLTKFEVYNPKNFSSRMTWEELFEGRFFSSYITKTSLNNPSDLTLAAMIKDPLFRLLEGENLKQKIFNFEQDLWAY
ncbi:MAG: gliding motility protein GldN [Chitinophagaceae bacterium]|nr:gliding motility protein GldN [Chitinophagaceae bacterium]